jgi:hypothetical protein
MPGVAAMIAFKKFLSAAISSYSREEDIGYSVLESVLMVTARGIEPFSYALWLPRIPFA